MTNNELLIKYFIDKAKPLSLEYVEQEKLSVAIALGDYFTDDMANEWFTDEVKVLNKLAEKNIISKKAAVLYSMINNNFLEASPKGNLYEKGIWTLNALKKHIFWETQRTLAKQLLDELYKVHL